MRRKNTRNYMIGSAKRKKEAAELESLVKYPKISSLFKVKQNCRQSSPILSRVPSVSMIYAMIKNDDLISTFPNVEIALKMFLSMMDENVFINDGPSVAYLGGGHGAMSTPFRATNNFFQHVINYIAKIMDLLH